VDRQARAGEGPKGAIETFIIDWPVLLFLGIIFGSLAPADGWWRSRAFRAGSVAALVFTIVAFASYAVAPDWMWMYFLDPGDVAWSLPGLAVAYLAAYALGFAAAIGLKPLGTRAVVIAAAATVLAEIGVIAITWSRYHLVGTRSEWLRGNAHELFSVSPSGPVKTIGILVPAFFVVLGVSLFWTWRSSRARPQS
jgi:hypothetical protein